MTAADAFDRLAQSGFAFDSETNKRNFINQLGNYSKRSQSQLAVFLRDTGLGPFATAGLQYNLEGLKKITLNPGLEATSNAAALRLRAEMLGRIVAPFAAVALANYLRWGRIDGDGKTPIGALKVGEENGKTLYRPFGQLTGADRGLRAVGALAFAEGLRAGRGSGHNFDRAVDDFVSSWSHLGMGPAPQMAYTAATGKTLSGVQIANKTKGKDSQAWENFKAALGNSNAIIAAATGYNNPKGRRGTVNQRFGPLLGPGAVRGAARPPGAERRQHR